MNMAVTKAPNNSIVVSIKDTRTLYNAYMPFLKNGGLFITIPRDFGDIQEYKLGREIMIILTLPTVPPPAPPNAPPNAPPIALPTAPPCYVTGKIAWINTEGIGSKRGFGVHFINDLDDLARRGIESVLRKDNDVKNFKESLNPTYTM